MSNHDQYDAAFAKGEMYEGDMERGMPTIAIYTVVLTVLFFATVFALIVYFRWETDMAKSYKVYDAPSKELPTLRIEENAMLSNKDNKGLNIADAMKRAEKTLK